MGNTYYIIIYELVMGKSRLFEVQKKIQNSDFFKVKIKRNNLLKLYFLKVIEEESLIGFLFAIFQLSRNLCKIDARRFN